MFSEIEARRHAAGISQVELCERAGVHPTTYTARKANRRTVSERTLQKLKTALDELVTERLAVMKQERTGS
ncbi:helix-turn-helix domain-containing protein [Martelella mediterranea]|uniref:Helix-turn-helix protein n=1 Tax=Martelella mediterranea TaxID=293089 RepID=A0A4R3NK42_9HYPH|nr:helix-turn-helix transcriptional regulator [Martelella mediterranea]TCT34624.1 helix-turn-helix protein [Martelella mediterranea]